MKIKLIPVRQMKKGRTKVWTKCTEQQAQAYELRDRKGKMLRRERSSAEAHRVAALFDKPKAPKDRRSLVGRRWADVKDKL